MGFPSSYLLCPLLVDPLPRKECRIMRASLTKVSPPNIPLPHTGGSLAKLVYFEPIVGRKTARVVEKPANTTVSGKLAGTSATSSITKTAVRASDARTDAGGNNVDRAHELILGIPELARASKLAMLSLTQHSSSERDMTCPIFNSPNV